MAEAIKDKRLLLVVLLTAAIAAGFWLGSRYPSLDEKALMGGELAIEDPLGFDPIFQIDADDPVITRIAYTTVNWLNTNRQGMSFGVLFAAAFMTLLSLLRRRSFEGQFSNTLLGTIIGAPLGVCVNCAAPIGLSMHAAGARIETALAVMFSSPTLNIVVLTMLFSLFPLYMVLTKLALTIIFILVVIPLVARFLAPEKLDAAEQLDRLQPNGRWAPTEENLGTPFVGGWATAGTWLISSYARNLWFVVKLTVPLMFLAGLLGAIAITLVPWESMSDLLPQQGMALILASMVLVALIGLFLPVPIAFDVVIVSALLAVGMPVKYSMVLLFTLGIFSVYPFLIVWRAMSPRIAITLSATLLAIGIVAGVTAHFFDTWNVKKQQLLFHVVFPTSDQWQVVTPRAVELPEGEDDAALVASLRRGALVWEPVERVETEAHGVTIERLPLEKREGSGEWHFARHYGSEFGLEKADSLPFVYRLMAPFYRNWPIAAGDVHHDGWTDVLLGSDRGLYLYANREGKGFSLQRIDIDVLATLYVANVALADLNNDGWLDIFVSAYRGGNYAIYNDHGRFHGNNLRALPESSANLANAAAFGDIDRDGDIDIVLGNWSGGPWTRESLEESRNSILWNSKSGFSQEALPGWAGETLSTLLSDINLDGYLDLMVGNDFSPPDVFYLGTGSESLKMLSAKDGVIPHSTETTMSIDSADIDNDLEPEIYIGQVNGRSSSSRPSERDARLVVRRVDEICDTFEDGDWKKRCERRVRMHEVIRDTRRSQDAYRCLEIADPGFQGDCLAWRKLNWAVLTERNPRLCPKIPPNWSALASICDDAFKAPPTYTPEAIEQQVEQITGRNVLLAPGSDGRFVDKAEEMGVALTGWTWNAKFADLDNDEWQDLYVVNGVFGSRIRETNVFFQNQNGQHFIDKTREAGLEGFLTAGSYLYVDFDNDGDLDIFTVTFDGPIWVYENRSSLNGAFVLELNDKLGNSHGIGSKIIIHYGPQGSRHQMRELKAGGGFLSYDAPQAHFGLGNYEGVKRIEIEWSTGERTVIAGEFPANYRYRITREERAIAESCVRRWKEGGVSW